ncbi:MAG TPA: energy transducer TonB [Bacteroidia bacterium]|jgi:TonB family protein|nr:energy transducer TonB [Bacteroidia bacterium]
MKNILAICFIIFSGTSLYSQTDTSGKMIDCFPSGCGVKAPFNVTKYLAKNIIYPEDARKNNIEGTAYVSFIIEKDGAIDSVKLLKGVNKGESLNKEALRVVSTMPKWTPGRQNGHPVRIRYNLPIRFILNNSASSNKRKN